MTEARKFLQDTRNLTKLRELVQNADDLHAKTQGLSIELSAFFDLFPDLLMVAGRDGQIRRINAASLHILGYRPNEMEGKQFFAYVHPQDVAETQEVMTMLEKEDLYTDFSNRYRHRDGHWVRLEWRATQWSDGITYATARVISHDGHEQRP